MSCWAAINAASRESPSVDAGSSLLLCHQAKSPVPSTTVAIISATTGNHRSLPDNCCGPVALSDDDDTGEAESAAEGTGSAGAAESSVVAESSGVVESSGESVSGAVTRS